MSFLDLDEFLIDLAGASRRGLQPGHGRQGISRAASMSCWSRAPSATRTTCEMLHKIRAADQGGRGLRRLRGDGQRAGHPQPARPGQRGKRPAARLRRMARGPTPGAQGPRHCAAAARTGDAACRRSCLWIFFCRAARRRRTASRRCAGAGLDRRNAAELEGQIIKFG